MAQVQLNMGIMDDFQLFLVFGFAYPVAYSLHCFALMLRSLSFASFCFFGGGGQNKLHLAGIWPKQGEG